MAKEINVAMLNESENDFRKKNYIHALRKYNALFDKVINDSGAALLSYRK